MSFSSTTRGARLARRLTATRLHEWGIPYDTALHDAVVQVVAELCANAVTHGRIPGRDFRLRLTADAARVRVEVDDTRSERVPTLPAPTDALPTSGRGLLLVAALSTRWDWHYRLHSPGKTVWAEVAATSRIGDADWSAAATVHRLEVEAGQEPDYARAKALIEEADRIRRAAAQVNPGQ